MTPMGRANGRNVWTPEEDAVVRAAWADDTIAKPALHAANKIARTVASIFNRATTLGCAKERRERQIYARRPKPEGPPKPVRFMPSHPPGATVPDFLRETFAELNRKANRG